MAATRYTLNQADVDADCVTEGVQAAATAGVVSFVADAEGNAPLLQNINLEVHSGTLSQEDALLLNSTVSLAAETMVNISGGTLSLSSSTTPIISMESSASLTLGGRLVLELSSLYSSVNSLVVNENYTLDLVEIRESDPLAASELSLLSSAESGIMLEDELELVLALNGQEFGYILNRDALVSEGIFSFLYLQPEPIVVPEPATATLSLLALCALMQRRRR